MSVKIIAGETSSPALSSWLMRFVPPLPERSNSSASSEAEGEALEAEEPADDVKDVD
jgi:hypothetical protein